MEAVKTVYIFSHTAEHTTARYFERAIVLLDEWRCVYLDRVFNIECLSREDILFFVDPAPAWPIGLEKSPCLNVAYFIDVHRDLNSRLEMARFFDVTFVAQKDYVESFRQTGCSLVFWLPLGCDEKVHNQASEIRPYDVGFIGKLGQRGTRRRQILDIILPHFKTNDFDRFYHPEEMSNIYGQSKIVFNVSINNDVNMRVFEALASGALLVTDRISNGLNVLFQEGVHYVGYDTADEAIEKIKYYLKNTEERESIASAGQKEVLENNMYLHRWHTIVEQIDKSAMVAPARKMSADELRILYAEIFQFLRQPLRVGVVVLKYGISLHLIQIWLRVCARWLNARVPLTPNAIRTKLLK